MKNLKSIGIIILISLFSSAGWGIAVSGDKLTQDKVSITLDLESSVVEINQDSPEGKTTTICDLKDRLSKELKELKGMAVKDKPILMAKNLPAPVQEKIVKTCGL